jgi:hypothetical protein
MKTILMILALTLVASPAMALGWSTPRQGTVGEVIHEMPTEDMSKAGKPWDNFHNALRNIFCKPDNPFRDPTTPSLCDL